MEIMKVSAMLMGCYNRTEKPFCEKFEAMKLNKFFGHVFVLLRCITICLLKAKEKHFLNERATKDKFFLCLITHTKKLHFCFLAAKHYYIYSFPLKAVYFFEPVHERSGNQAAPLIFIAFILNSRGRIQYIAVVYDFPFQISNLGTYNFSEM